MAIGILNFIVLLRKQFVARKQIINTEPFLGSSTEISAYSSFLLIVDMAGRYKQNQAADLLNAIAFQK